jgi:tyrosinase
VTTQVHIAGAQTLATLHHRRSVAKLTPAQLANLRKAFAATMALDDDRGFWYFAGWHGEPFNWCEHHTDLFLPWHRAYLHYFELALQTQVPGVTLPWWDWTTSATLPGAYTDDQAGGEDNPLFVRKVRVYRSGQDQPTPPRAPGAAQVRPLPYKTRWSYAMKATSFGEFQRRLEAIHDDVHVWVGGIMSDIAWAAYDPLFFAHHTMIDRAWRIWQHGHPGALPRQDLLDVALRPNGIKVRDVLDVKQLGYEYAAGASHAKGTTG